MDGATEPKAQEGEASSERERSTIEFPYSDLDAAVEVARGVHSAGGNACDDDQLAAELKMEARGGGFRLRVSAAKMFGLITYERGGRIQLTDLGRQVIDPDQERSARVSAFLSVPLYAKVFEHFRGGPLPPQAGLERAIESMGVGAKVKDKARQVLLRAAKQAGFLDAAADRLVRPQPKQDVRTDRGSGDASTGDDSGKTRPASGGPEHPLIQGLLLTLPPPGHEWLVQDRVNWLTMAASIFTMIYKGEAGVITIKSLQTSEGATSAR